MVLCGYKLTELILLPTPLHLLRLLYRYIVYIWLELTSDDIWAIIISRATLGYFQFHKD